MDDLITLVIRNVYRKPIRIGGYSSKFSAELKARDIIKYGFDHNGVFYSPKFIVDVEIVTYHDT